MKVILDAMGGDNAPLEIVKGAIEAKKEYGIDIILVGDEDQIRNILKNENAEPNSFEIVNTTQVIMNNESPTNAIRNKKDSSMVVGLKMLKQDKGDAFISAGSTGALIAGGTLLVGRIKGILRPGLAPIIPSKKGPFMLIDAGANAECKPQYVLQFAMMSEIYMKKVLKKDSPTVGLVNIGEEEEKGTQFTRDCYKLLKESDINFKGNVEARDIPFGAADIIVCDGYAGNIILKTYEGAAEVIFSIMKEKIMSSSRAKLGGLLLKPVFKEFRKEYDYTEYGGAVLLGTKKAVIKAHGNSKAKAIKNAIRQAKLFIESDVVNNISNGIEKRFILENKEDNEPDNVDWKVLM